MVDSMEIEHSVSLMQISKTVTSHRTQVAVNFKLFADRLLRKYHFSTGFITNEAFDTPKVIIDNFDGSLPENHYEIKRRNELRLRPNVHAVRVDDIPLDIR
jgi:hypothetical protein